MRNIIPTFLPVCWADFNVVGPFYYVSPDVPQTDRLNVAYAGYV